MMPPSSSRHTPAGDDEWRVPLALAIGLHVLLVLLILFPPTFLFPRRELPEVQTINLFDAGELNQPAASGPKQTTTAVTKKGSPKPEAPKPEPKQAEPPKPPEPKPEPLPPPEPPKPEPIPEPPKPEPVSEPPKPEPVPEPPKPEPKQEPPKPTPEPPKDAISLSPKKVKKKVAQVKPKPDKIEPPKAKSEAAKTAAKNDVKILKSLERIQARVKERQENEAIRDKLAHLRDSLHEIATPGPAEEPSGAETGGPATPGAGGPDAGGTASSGAGGGPSMLDEALKKYYIALSRKIHSNWALPDTQDWDPALEAIAVIVIKRDGSVVETFFEKKSDNISFDQYVEKTIQASTPLPPIPSDIQEDELEIGLIFRPSGLF